MFDTLYYMDGVINRIVVCFNADKNTLSKIKHAIMEELGTEWIIIPEKDW